MTVEKLPFDATASTLAAVYQFYVAVHKCFTMKRGQRVIIERFGDVTVSGQEQVEVKKYNAPLTDNHTNIWQTLNNWLSEDFDHSHYSALILWTTQEIGPQSKFNEWNAATKARRIEILSTIRDAAEDKAKEHRQEHPGRINVSEALSLQRKVFTDESKLAAIIDKVFISAASPHPIAYCDEICDVYAKTILRRKRREFLEGLIGYILSPEIAKSPIWELTFEQFDNKVLELSRLYQVGTCVFPSKFCSTDGKAAKASGEFDRHLFVTKINDIQYEVVVEEAIKHYVHATRTVKEEFADYEISPNVYHLYSESIATALAPKYRAAVRNAKECFKDSQDFYDACMGDSHVPEFPGLGVPDVGFRNGVIHMNFNDPKKELKWKLM